MSLMETDIGSRWLAEALGLASEYDVFPWQRDLLGCFRSGRIPSALAIPTGLGKTAVMAIWLVARACGASLPRRLVYVVDRRAVVDQATTEAERLRAYVDRSQEFRSSLGLSRPLPISTLRGRFVDNREWLDDPAAPAIIVGTVDMVGSRLLFEGYGVSRKMRPYHAGLLGVDTLVVLDEAHLVPPFEHLLRAIETDPALRSSGGGCQSYVPPFRLLALSATGRTPGAGRVELAEPDFEHKVVKQRLNAKKALQIEPLDAESKIEDALAKQAWKLASEDRTATRILVYSDSREVARKAKEAIEKFAKGDRMAGKPQVKVETELFVGGRRVFERERAKERLKELGFIAGTAVERSCPVFLFATSAGEVGVDLDADHMVCDLVAWERMVQRLGRVNRRGEGEAKIIVFQPKPDKKTQQALDKQEGQEGLSDKERETVDRVRRLGFVRDLFRRLPQRHDRAYDASPAALYNLLKASTAADGELQRMLENATTPEPLRPPLTRPLVEAWAMTSLEKHTGRPAIQP